VIIALAITLIVSAGMSSAGARAQQRALYNTALLIQEGIREAQQRAVLEGVDYKIVFAPLDKCYRMYKGPTKVDKVVYWDDGVTYADNLQKARNETLTFTPRGTPSDGFTITLKAGRYTRTLTITPSSGRVLINTQT